MIELNAARIQEYAIGNLCGTGNDAGFRKKCQLVFSRMNALLFTSFSAGEFEVDPALATWWYPRGIAPISATARRASASDPSSDSSRVALPESEFESRMKIVRRAPSEVKD
jgi:hypothetical protein